MNRKILFIMTLLFIIIVTGCQKEDIVSKVEDKTKVEETEGIVEVEEVEETEEIEEDIAIEIEDEIEEEPVIDLSKMGLNPLTGLYIDKELIEKRPFGIMINNHKKAMPQSGLEQADVIYEALVEGGICRLFALYKDFDAEKIGPVRSARHYFLDFAFDFDSLYVHYGQSPQAKAAFSNWNAPNLNGLSGLDSIMCFQDPSRRRPHSTYTSYEGLQKGLDYKGYRTEKREDLVNKFIFSEEPIFLEEGDVAEKVILDYSYYQYAWFEYDDETELYNRFQFGAAHIDVETNNQLAFDNVIIQLVNVWNIKGDTAGRLDMNLISTGKGYYITKGKVIPINWSKDSHYSTTKYTLEDGSALEMNTGKTWISIFPNYRKNKLIIE